MRAFTRIDVAACNPFVCFHVLTAFIRRNAGEVGVPVCSHWWRVLPVHTTTERAFEMIRSAVSLILAILLIGSIALAQTPPAQNSGQSSPGQSSEPSSPAPDSPAQTPPVQEQAAPPPAPPVAPVPMAIPKVQVFAGYSLFRADLGNLNSTNFDVDLNLFPNTLVTRNNFNGWSAEAQYNFGPWVGAVIDVSGYARLAFHTRARSRRIAQRHLLFDSGRTRWSPTASGRISIRSLTRSLAGTA